MVKESLRPMSASSAPPSPSTTSRDWAPDYPVFRQVGAAGVARYTPFVRGDRFGRQYLHPFDSIPFKDYDEMRFDGQIRAGLWLLKSPIIRARWSIECEDKDIAAYDQEVVKPVWPQLARIALRMLDFGHSFAENIWERAYNFKVTSSQSQVQGQATKVYPEAIRTRKFVDMDPLTYYILTWGRSADLAGINQFIPLNANIPENKLLYFAHDVEYGELYGIPHTKPCYPYWYFKRLHMENTNVFYETYSVPMKKGRFPEGFTDRGGAKIPNDQLMLDMLEDLRNNHAIALNSSRWEETKEFMWDIEFMESQRTGADHLAYMSYLDLMILKSMLIPQLALETGDSGSYNLAEEQLDFFALNVESIMTEVEDGMNRYLKRINKYMFGPRAPQATFAFHPLYKDTWEGLVNVLLETIGSGKPIPTKDGGGLVPDWMWIAENSGIPLQTLDEQELQQWSGANEAVNPTPPVIGPDGQPVPGTGSGDDQGGGGGGFGSNGSSGNSRGQNMGGQSSSQRNWGRPGQGSSAGGGGPQDASFSEQWSVDDGVLVWTPR